MNTTYPVPRDEHMKIKLLQLNQKIIKSLVVNIYLKNIKMNKTKLQKNPKLLQLNQMKINVLVKEQQQPN